MKTFWVRVLLCVVILVMFSVPIINGELLYDTQGKKYQVRGHFHHSRESSYSSGKMQRGTRSDNSSKTHSDSGKKQDTAHKFHNYKNSNTSGMKADIENAIRGITSSSRLSKAKNYDETLIKNETGRKITDNKMYGINVPLQISSTKEKVTKCRKPKLTFKKDEILDIREHAAKSIKLRCHVRGASKRVLKVMWLKNGSPIEDSHLHQR